MRRLALLIVLAACHSRDAHTPPPPHTPTPPHTTAPPTVVDADTFLASLDPAQPFDVVIGGDGDLSYLARQKCGYWEWTTAEMDHDRMSTWRTQYHDESAVTLIAGDRQATLDWNDLRAYLAPSFSHDYARGDATAPPEVVAELADADAPASLRALEFCLAIGATYHAVAHDDEFELPGPRGPTTHHHRVLWLSDAPLVDGKPVHDETPTYRGWSY